MSPDYIEEIKERIDDIKSLIGMKENELWDLENSLEALQMELEDFYEL